MSETVEKSIIRIDRNLARIAHALEAIAKQNIAGFDTLEEVLEKQKELLETLYESKE